jgi:glycosyltransferase involved in cell wall biosynthesis
MEGPEPLEWPKRFARERGRPPRVLHICNVANYAYANARLMQAAGVEVEVIDPDSYHIMASPEWYEAEVQGEWGDDANPSWRRLDLRGYERPDWFTQGPRDLVFSRLLARTRGNTNEAIRLRRAIERANASRAAILNSSAIMNRLWRVDNVATRCARAIARQLVYARPHPETLRAPTLEIFGPPALQRLGPIAARLRTAFDHFDIVQGYGLGAMFPLAVGKHNVVAYELGTLRGLPFEDTEAGHICAWLYRRAPYVFVTNVDCVQAARKLQVQEDRVVPTLHAFDVNAALAFRGARWDWVPSPFFFAPARHHWRAGSASFLKGNDVIVPAALRLASEGFKFRIVFVEWGDDVNETKRLIAQSGLSDRCVWLRPMSRQLLWPIYVNAVAVIDQFSASALGGVGLEAMALGRRLLTKYDTLASRTFFATDPPLMNCDGSDALYRCMRACLDDADDALGIGRRARSWMCAEHSVERQLRGQFVVYERMSRQAAEPS